MAKENLLLYVAAYASDSAASLDYTDLKTARDVDEVRVLAAIIANRDSAGKIDVKEHDAGKAHRAAGWGAVGGLVVGLFSPPLLLATGIGAGVGGALHELAKHHEEKKLGEEFEQYLPPDSSAIMAIVDDEYADRLDAALSRSQKKIRKAIDSRDYDKLVKALTDAGYDIEAALGS